MHCNESVRAGCPRLQVAPLRSALPRAVLAALLSLPPTAALAQQSSGGLYGSVAAGVVQAGGGAQVIVRNTGTNAVQIRPLTADGKYSLSGLSPGEYEITLMQANRTLATATATVRPGSSSAVAQFGGAAKATTLDGVQVTGARINNARDNITPIDVSTPELVRQYSSELFRKTGVDTSGHTGAGGTYSNLLTQLPGKFMSQVASGGTSGYASFSGASGTETRYYVNEFDTTYDVNGAGSNMVPGELVGYATVISNGASAKYSNAMGGSVAAETKSGDNTWRGGFSSYIIPPYSQLLRPHRKNYLMTGRDGGHYWYEDNSGLPYNGQQQAQFNNTLWASGPLVRDRLFLGLAYQSSRPDAQSHTLTGNDNVPQYLDTRYDHYANPALTLGWNPTEDQRLDLVASRNRRDNHTSSWKLSEPGNPGSALTPSNTNTWKMREKFYVGRWRWHMNDSMDLSLMGGYFTHQENNADPIFGNDIYALTWFANEPLTSLSNGTPGNTVNYHPYRKRGLRADWTWQVTDDHKINLGAERYRFDFGNKIWWYTKGGYYIYYNDPTGKQDYFGKDIQPDQTPYVLSWQRVSGGPYLQTNRGAYLEDYWQALDNLVVYAGVRRDNSISNAGNPSLRTLNLWTTSPRLGLSWDVKGDSSMKLGLTWGRYAMSVPGNLLANALNNYQETYTLSTYDGINPDGTPIDPRLFATRTTGSISQDPLQLSSRNLKTSLQENWGLYLQDNGLIPDWTETIELNYSKVKRAISVWRDLNQSGKSSASYRYLQALGYADPHIENYVLINPGRDLILTNDFDHDGKLETVTIPASATGMARPQRKNLTFSMEFVHPETDEQPFFLDLNFTWKHVYGNWEGYYDESGRNNDPVTGSLTYQYASLTNGATGNLPQDVRYAVTTNALHTFGDSGFSAGLNLAWRSGSVKQCFSQYPDSNDAASSIPGTQYSSFYCGGDTPTPRGSIGRLPSYWTDGWLLAWDRTRGAHRLRLELGISNLFNRTQVVTWKDPNYATYDKTSGQWNMNGTYGKALYLSPRSAHFGIYYNWN